VLRLTFFPLNKKQNGIFSPKIPNKKFLQHF